MAFPFILRRWKIDNGYSIDAIARHENRLFIARNNKLVWFVPNLEEPMRVERRWLPQQIRSIVVNNKVLLLSMAPRDFDHVSETIVFEKGHSITRKWYDNTLYETLVGSNILRVNYNGKVHLNDICFTIPMYTAMTTINDKYMCGAISEQNKKGMLYTRIDLYDITSVDPTEIVYTYRLLTPKCSHPCNLSVFFQDCYPQKLIYFIISYRIGGTYVGNNHFPPENKTGTATMNHLPDEDTIISLAVDYPYFYTLNTKYIVNSYRFPSIMLNPMFIGSYNIYRSAYQHTNKIVAIKRQVFWNGDDELRSLEVIEN